MNTTFLAMEVLSILKIFLIFVGLYVLMRILMSKEALITKSKYEPEMWALNQNKIPLSAHSSIYLNSKEYDEIFQAVQEMQADENAPIAVTNWSVEFHVSPDVAEEMKPSNEQMYENMSSDMEEFFRNFKNMPEQEEDDNEAGS